MPMNNKKPTIIGSKTMVDFPQLDVSKIPAKVDTGADSSSIWASDIREMDDKLHFRLFDRESPFFDGREIITEKYKTKLIKNSFGRSEFRYKVPINVTIEGRKIKSQFTLADRSRNRYPVLIGRRTLKSKFLVDVAHGPVENEPLQILVLVRVGNKKTREQFDLLARKLQDKAEITIARYDEISMVADSNTIKMRIKPNGRDISDFGFIYFFTRFRDAELAAMVAAYAKRFGIGFSDQAAALLAANAKSHQCMWLAGRGVNLPRTVYMDRKVWASSYDVLAESLGVPFVFKSDKGKKGRDNFLISNKREFSKACRHVEDEGLQMIAQTYVKNDGYYRLVVMGRDVVLAMYRKVDSSKAHTYSKKRDGDARVVEPEEVPSVVQQMAVSAAQLMSLEVAGVDILQDSQTGEWYCIEVNNSPQLVGGAFVDRKMQSLGAFLVEEGKR